MSKKHKCKLCAQSMQWAFPGRVTSDNYEYAKHCLNAIKSSLLDFGSDIKLERIQRIRKDSKENAENAITI